MRTRPKVDDLIGPESAAPSAYRRLSAVYEMLAGPKVCDLGEISDDYLIRIETLVWVIAPYSPFVIVSRPTSQQTLRRELGAKKYCHGGAGTHPRLGDIGDIQTV